jgi:hypothetical protein
MSQKANKEIQEKYALYKDLYENGKLTKTQSILVNSKKPNNNRYLVSDLVKLEHVTQPHEITLVAEVKIANHKYFHFVVQCNYLSQAPFFRYDSDGPTHRNYDEELSLVDQQVTTPHFHRFNDKGFSIAFKTTPLLDENARASLEDIRNCIGFFCDVGNIETVQGGFPTITIMPSSLQLTLTQVDPTAGINFI